MTEIFTLTLKNVVQILFFIALGYALRHSKSFPKESGKTLSVLAAWIFSPAYTVRSLAKDFTVPNISENLLILGAGVIFLAVTLVIGFLLSRLLTKDATTRRIFMYAMTFPNYGYFGYPLVESVFGQEILADYIVFCQPFNFACAILGYWLLTQGKNFTWKSFFLSPVVWSPFLGAALGLSGWKLPALAENTLAALGSCMSPTVMILMGFVLGTVSLKKLFTYVKGYGLSLVRLLLIPILGGGLYYLCGTRGIWLLMPVATMAMPIGANVIVFPESCGIDTGEHAKMVFLSYILAVAVLPPAFGIIARLAGI